MKLLLDTHAFIWLDSQADRLSQKPRAAINDQNNSLYVSTASLWETQIKTQLGKLSLQKPLKQIVEEQQQSNQLLILPVIFTHVLALGDLPLRHKDPFDRLLIAQATSEEAVLISHDTIIAAHSVPVLW